ncbi:alpha/beta hydrolase [Glaciihabitans arcticus]|uniref:Alpha/beta hydrolase n=1 Tax=Glaciihabitans arcticus TaxID=2668039 RepID=A0A4Q9GXI0_9MICO|nr:alpha/beta hydrolase [Glaciihabitans arcticus]TBN56980.1 alpha/beta hydrolase [Glaciihabitans arcticus]
MPGSVVMVHGLRTSSSMWRVQRLELERLGYTVITPDLPGHGSRMAERFTVAESVRTIERAVADGGPDTFLVGFSLGGYLSLHYAGLEERPVRGILAASCGTQPTRLILDGWRVGAAVIHRFSDRGLALNNFMVRRFVRDPDLANDVISGGVALEVMDDALRELRVLNLPRSLAAIDAPVWLVNGTLDHFRVQERRYLRAARRGRLVHVRGATHMVSVTRPEAFTRILVEALAQLP